MLFERIIGIHFERKSSRSKTKFYRKFCQILDGAVRPGDVTDRRDALLMADQGCGDAGLAIAHKSHIGDTPSDALTAVEAAFVPVIVKKGRRQGGFPDGAVVFPDHAINCDGGIARFLANVAKGCG
jgi:hypothetical protein